jgi:steroid delta-isomerase-like uncharacterized protein
MGRRGGGRTVGEARDTAERYYKHFGTGDMDGAAAMFGESCTHVTPAGAQSNEEHKLFGGSFKAALPDGHMAVDTAVESGEDVAIEGRFMGTHKGDLVTPQGTIPASGRTIELRYSDFFKVIDGKIVEHRIYWDQMDMMQQLGAMPPG